MAFDVLYLVTSLSRNSVLVNWDNPNLTVNCCNHQHSWMKTQLYAFFSPPRVWVLSNGKIEEHSENVQVTQLTRGTRWCKRSHTYFYFTHIYFGGKLGYKSCTVELCKTVWENHRVFWVGFFFFWLFFVLPAFSGHTGSNLLFFPCSELEHIKL